MNTQPKKTKAKKIQILPREPLTNKALHAIKAYAWHKCKGLHIFDLLVKYTLEAERMKRADLYQWLEDHGYKWDSVSWRQTKGAENEPTNRV